MLATHKILHEAAAGNAAVDVIVSGIMSSIAPDDYPVQIHPDHLLFIGSEKTVKGKLFQSMHKNCPFKVLSVSSRKSLLDDLSILKEVEMRDTPLPAIGLNTTLYWPFRNFWLALNQARTILKTWYTDQHQPIFVHCHMGINRSAAVLVYCLIMDFNLTAREAIQCIAEANTKRATPLLALHNLTYRYVLFLVSYVQQHIPIAEAYLDYVGDAALTLNGSYQTQFGHDYQIIASLLRSSQLKLEI